MAARQRVVRVPSMLMARSRVSARTWGKSDPIHALAVARAVLREPDLPVACHDAVSWELRLLVDRREVLVGQRVAVTNRLLARLHRSILSGHNRHGCSGSGHGRPSMTT